MSGRVLGGRGAAEASGTRPVPGGRRAHRPGATWSPQHDQLQLLASLVESGVTLDVAFETLALMGGTRGTQAAAVQVRDALRAGRSFSDALAEVGAPDHVRALVRGGERVGRVAPSLRAAGELLRRLATLRAELLRAVLYPTVVLSLGVVILVIVALVVIPPLERTFTELGGELPVATRAVLAISRPLRSPALLLLLPAGIGLGSVLRRRRRASGRSGSGVLPSSRLLERDVRLVVLARLMATMLDGGLPLIDALRTVEDGLPPGRVRDRVRSAVAGVESGGTALADDAIGGLLDPAERELLAVAERTGLLAMQWERVAARRTEALTARIGRIGAVTEPLLVVLVGAIVGGAVLALYLPTFRVLELV